MGRFAQELRSLVDQQYRRAFRNLRHLPRVNYRCVIDAGANRGAFTDAFLRLHDPERIAYSAAKRSPHRNTATPLLSRRRVVIRASNCRIFISLDRICISKPGL